MTFSFSLRADVLQVHLNPYNTQAPLLKYQPAPLFIPKAGPHYLLPRQSTAVIQTWI